MLPPPLHQLQQQLQIRLRLRRICNRIRLHQQPLLSKLLRRLPIRLLLLDQIHLARQVSVDIEFKSNVKFLMNSLVLTLKSALFVVNILFSIYLLSFYK